MVTTKKKRIQLQASVFRLNISYLSGAVFGTWISYGKKQKREPGVSPKLEELKRHVLELLMHNESHRGLKNYTIVWQTHTSCQRAHLDILLLYDKPIKKSQSSFDYLLQICPQDLDFFSDKQGKKPQIFITSYSLSRLNTAILEYGMKEDPDPLNTFSPEDSVRHLTLSAIKVDPYGYLEDRMREDPYNFDLAEYVDAYNLAKQIKGWSGIKHKLCDIRCAVIARLQLQKPGIQLITRELIQSTLTYDELLVFDTYPCFQTIVDHLNQIPKYGPQRPHKTKNLFISGRKDIGKTALALELGKLVGNYNVKYQNKYLNRYSNRKYGFIVWNEVKLTDFTHTWILEFLEGMEVSIPMRYNTCRKTDNPLVYMTSNLTLDEHIRNRYRDNDYLYQHAVQNLGARITAVEVPVPMFFMQKLLIKAKPLEIFS